MDKYDFIILGVGTSGIVAAYKILKINPKAKILLLEKEKTCGGKCASICFDNSILPLGAQFLFEDPLIFQLVNELKIKNKLFQVDPIGSFYKDGKINVMRRSLFSLFTFKQISMGEKLKSVYSLMKLHYIEKKPRTSISNWLESNCSREVVDYVFQPYLTGLLTSPIDKIPSYTGIECLKMIFRRVYNLDGGIPLIFENLLNKLNSLVTIKTNFDIKKIKSTDINVVYGANNQYFESKYILSSIPPQSLLKIYKVSSRNKNKLEKIEYSKTNQLFVSFKEKIPFKTMCLGLPSIYTDLFSFINYNQKQGCIFSPHYLSEEETIDEFISLFPSLKNKICNVFIKKWEYSLPLVNSKIDQKISDIFYLIGDYVDVPSVNTAISSVDPVLKEIFQ